MTINWASIPIADHDLSHLGDPITEEEVKVAILALPSDKAPGLDGFTGKFFKECWDIIKDDLMLAINHFSNLHTENLHWLNSANIGLIPKKDGAEDIRLTPHMNDIVSIAQSAFIKGWSIHDNFLYV